MLSATFFEHPGTRTLSTLKSLVATYLSQACQAASSAFDFFTSDMLNLLLSCGVDSHPNSLPLLGTVSLPTFETTLYSRFFYMRRLVVDFRPKCSRIVNVKFNIAPFSCNTGLILSYNQILCPK